MQKYGAKSVAPLRGNYGLFWKFPVVHPPETHKTTTCEYNCKKGVEDKTTCTCSNLIHLPRKALPAHRGKGDMKSKTVPTGNMLKSKQRKKAKSEGMKPWEKLGFTGHSKNEAAVKRSRG